MYKPVDNKWTLFYIETFKAVKNSRFSFGIQIAIGIDSNHGSNHIYFGRLSDGFFFQ